jgi:hypothetical protein
MLNGMLISCKELIGEIYRDKKYRYNLPYQDSLEWIADSLELIGAPKSLLPMVKKITIDNYRGMLPCNLHDITQAAGSYGGCTPFPMRSTTNTFGSVFECEDQLLTTLINESSVTTSEDPIGEDISGNPVYTFQNGNMSMPESTSDTSNSSGLTDPTYNVNGGYIFTNFENGFVYLAYMALPTDEEGFPLIPDNRRFKEAVKAYIVFKIDYILWRNKELDKDVYLNSELEWLFYVSSAGNVARVPNYDGAQSLLNQMKLIPQKYSHNQFFKYLGA